MAVLVWCAFLLRSEIVLELVTLIFLLSAVLKVRRAPMIRLYDGLFNRRQNAEEILVDENSIFFAHLLAFVLSVTCLFIVYTAQTFWAWYTVLAFALLKSASAFGFCPASKLYDCMLNGNCCVKTKKNGVRTNC
jgi:hypothetical protein